MRLLFCLLFLFSALVSFSQEDTLIVKNKLTANASVSLNSNGIAPVPAFALGKPALMASLSLAKNRFSFDPTLAYGLDLRPWFIDNWLHYKIINKPAFELRTGFNISCFFSQYTTAPGFVLYGQRFFTFELAGIYKISPVSSISLLCWNDRGQEPESLIGTYLALFWDRSDINIGKQLLLNLDMQLYYINYTGENDGLFVSPKISASCRKFPSYSLFYQANQAIQSNIKPFPAFISNVGISYTL
jgi:hypothetical protein